MKIPRFWTGLVFTIATVAAAVAGGGACRFETDGRRLLSQSPVLGELVTSSFSIQDSGKMGPMDAPFDGGRLYTYMEFRATSLEGQEKEFLIRLHFQRRDAELTLASAEILPMKEDHAGKEPPGERRPLRNEDRARAGAEGSVSAVDPGS